MVSNRHLIKLVQIKAMKGLVDGRKAGDELFLHCTHHFTYSWYRMIIIILLDSGHGAQTECEENDDTEPDGFDEGWYSVPLLFSGINITSDIPLHSHRPM